jgi:hypothetical protein
MKHGLGVEKVEQWHPPFDPAHRNAKHSHTCSYQGKFQGGVREVGGNAVLFAADGTTEVFSNAATAAAKAAAALALAAAAAMRQQLVAIEGIIEAGRKKQHADEKESTMRRLREMETDSKHDQHDRFEAQSKAMADKLAKPSADATAAAARAAAAAAALAESLTMDIDTKVFRWVREAAMAAAGLQVGETIKPDAPKSFCQYKSITSDSFTAFWQPVEVPRDQHGKAMYGIDRYELQYRLGEKWIETFTVVLIEEQTEAEKQAKAKQVAKEKAARAKDRNLGKKKQKKKSEKGAAENEPVKLEVTVSGLSPYSVYRTHVRAHAEGGDWGDWGAESKCLTVAIQPAAPAIEAQQSLAAVRGTSADVHWSTASDHGNAITKYEIMFRRTTGGVSGDGGDIGGVTIPAKRNNSGMIFSMHASVTGLTVNSTYQLRVRALNEAGWGDWSEPLDIRTQPF